jgi:hypothetical protein
LVNTDSLKQPQSLQNLCSECPGSRQESQLWTHSFSRLQVFRSSPAILCPDGVQRNSPQPVCAASARRRLGPSPQKEIEHRNLSPQLPGSTVGSFWESNAFRVAPTDSRLYRWLVAGFLVKLTLTNCQLRVFSDGIAIANANL